MSSNEDTNENLPSHYDLFKKSTCKIEWDEKSPERSSVPSFARDDYGQISSEEEIFHKSEDVISGPSSHFLPSMVRFEPRKVSFEIKSSSNSAYSVDSLEDTNIKTLETVESEDHTETEEESVQEFQITDRDLGNKEGCEKEDGDPVDYLDKEVFPVLLPCLEKMLFAAKENDVLKTQKSRFNGLDYLAELLWNCNPNHPERHGSYLPIFDIPFVQKHLEENPRPIFPQSWLWTRDQAAIVIQAAVRGYLVRCQHEVQEMRQFWKTLAEEKQLKELPTSTIQSEVKNPEQKPIVLEPSSSSNSFFSHFLDGKS